MEIDDISVKHITKNNEDLPMKKIFQMPKPVNITGRTSSITNAFVNGIIPVIEPAHEEVEDVLQTLGMDKENIACAYCGDPHTEWDHFRPLIKDKLPTGYITEIHNLVPCCGKCNQSKGNTNWKTWMLGKAPLSPRSRQIPDIEHRIAKLEEFEQHYTPVKLDFEQIVGTEMWKQHLENCRSLHSLMQESQKHSDIIRKLINDSVNI